MSIPCIDDIGAADGECIGHAWIGTGEPVTTSDQSAVIAPTCRTSILPNRRMITG